MVGNVQDATAVVNGAGIQIGEGSFRTAYLYNGVVYKIELEPGWNANTLEYEQFLALSQVNLPDNIGIPETTLFDIGGQPIIAMEYIHGTPCLCACGGNCGEWECDYDDISNATFHMVLDLAQDNVLECDGRYWLIDLSA